MNTNTDVSNEVRFSSRSERIGALVVDSALIWAASLIIAVPLFSAWAGIFSPAISDMVENPGLFLLQTFGLVFLIAALVATLYFSLLKTSPGQKIFSVDNSFGVIQKVFLITCLPLLVIALAIVLI